MVPPWTTLGEELLLGIKFGGFSGFGKNPPNLNIFAIRQI